MSALLDRLLWAEPATQSVACQPPSSSNEPPDIERCDTPWSMQFVTASGFVIDAVERHGHDLFNMPLGGAKGWASIHLNRHFRQWPQGRLVIYNHATYQSWTRRKTGSWRLVEGMK